MFKDFGYLLLILSILTSFVLLPVSFITAGGVWLAGKLSGIPQPGLGQMWDESPLPAKVAMSILALAVGVTTVVVAKSRPVFLAGLTTSGSGFIGLIAIFWRR